MGKNVAVLLFDLGGVLIENVGFTTLQGLLPHVLDGAALRARWLSSPTVRSFELGRTTRIEFADSFVDEWGLSLTPEAFLEEFASWPKGFYPGAEAAMADLRRHHTVACLSNANAVHWDRFDGFSEHFDHAFSSHLIGRIKPDDDAFLHVLEVLDAQPADVLFFDDSLPNVEAASRLGIRSRLVDGFAETRMALMQEGCL